MLSDSFPTHRTILIRKAGPYDTVEPSTMGSPAKKAWYLMALLLVLRSVEPSAAQLAGSDASFSSLLHDQQAAAIESYSAKDTFSRGCGVRPPDPAQLQAAQTKTSLKKQELAGSTAIEASALIAINVYMHIVSGGPAVTDGNIPDSWILAQINVMNKAYVATGFQVRYGRNDTSSIYSIYP